MRRSASSTSPRTRDRSSTYREDRSGQILEEGITEAGALSSWTAAATSYSTHGLAMLPFYIYYSMFGFQRVGDLIWAAADQRARGFLIGATAGRTTLSGEGLQHQDGTSHLVAATVPNCRAYDPATAGELAVIVDRGMREMLEEQSDVFYYVTAMNENVAQPSLPAEAHEGVLRGMYRFRAGGRDGARRVQLLGSGAILGEAVKAAEAARGASTASPPTSGASPASASWRATASPARRHGGTARAASTRSYVGEQLAPTRGPIVVATDYVRAVPEQIRAFLPPGRRCVTLGTDGFGRSDTRAALRAPLRGRRARHRRIGAAPTPMRRGPSAGWPSSSIPIPERHAACCLVAGSPPRRSRPAFSRFQHGVMTRRSRAAELRPQRACRKIFRVDAAIRRSGSVSRRVQRLRAECSRQWHRHLRFVRFVVAAGASVPVNILTRIIFSHWVAYEIAVLISHLVGMVTAYLLTKLFVFDPSGRSVKSELGGSRSSTSCRRHSLGVSASAWSTACSLPWASTLNPSSRRT